MTTEDNAQSKKLEGSKSNESSGKDRAKQDITLSKSTNLNTHPSTAPIILLCAGVLLLWAALPTIFYFAFPNWEIRGTVGDTFGAVNALFSGLAFAGVIYSLNLQRKELNYQRSDMLANREAYEAQLSEMKASRELLAQPLPIPDIKLLFVERPRLYYSPPQKEHSAQSRYSVSVSVSNPTQYPAINVNVTCFLQFDESALGATDSYLSIIAPGATIDDPRIQPHFLLVGDHSGSFFDALRQNNPKKVPTLHIFILFKNVVGAHFRLIQSFRVYAGESNSSTLRLWHTGIVGFSAKYKQELAQLIELKRKGREDDWDELFHAVKEEFSESVIGDEKVGLRVEAVPGSFTLKHISREEFEEEMKGASYPQLISTVYDCPIEIESRQ